MAQLESERQEAYGITFTFLIDKINEILLNNSDNNYNSKIQSLLLENLGVVVVVI